MNLVWIPRLESNRPSLLERLDMTLPVLPSRLEPHNENLSVWSAWYDLQQILLGRLYSKQLSHFPGHNLFAPSDKQDNRQADDGNESVSREVCPEERHRPE